MHEVGSAVTHIAVGDAVLLHPLMTCGYCHFCRAGDDMHCTDSVFPGSSPRAGSPSYIKTNARAIVPLRPGVTPVDVGPLGCAGMTAYGAVKKALPYAYPGSYTVALGAGGLGHIGIQALRALSQTEIIVVDRNAEALEHARGWGADQTVQAQADGSHVQEIKDRTGGGAQVVLDFVGEGGAEREAVLMLGTRASTSWSATAAGSTSRSSARRSSRRPASWQHRRQLQRRGRARRAGRPRRREAHQDDLPAGGRERRAARAGRRPDDRPRHARAERELTRST